VVGTIVWGEDIRKGYRKVNMVEMLYTHVWKWKNEICRNYSKKGRKEEDKGELWNG
jgi:hypothetical protein